MNIMILRQAFTGLLLCLLIITGFLFVYSDSAPAISLKQLLGISTNESQQAPEIKPVAKQGKNFSEKSATGKKPDEAGNQETSTKILSAQLVLSDLEKTLSVLNQTQRKKLLADEKTFSDFVKQEANNASMLVAARANNVDKSERTQILTQRGVDSIIREIYLNQLLASKIPADFPNDEQVQEYYETNKDKFVVNERIHIWQIFLPVTEGSSKKDIELLKKQAESISNDLQKKKTDFSTAANKFSKHEASRLSGGYMGLINVSDMKPEIKEAVKSLKQDVISKPVKTDEGIHILKRGTILPSQAISLEQVKPKISELMLKQLRAQLRDAVFKQANITYPVDITDKKIEEWRLKLRTN